MTFEPLDARKEFQKFLATRGLREQALGVLDGFEAMFDFYREMRPSRCSTEQADMLLFEWGVYNWGQGENFQLGLTRQLVLDPPEGDEDQSTEDEDFWQLHLTFYYEPTEELRAWGRSHKWCNDLSEIDPFRIYALQSAPFLRCARLRPTRMELHFECAG